MSSFFGKKFPLALFIHKRINGDYPNVRLTHVEWLCMVGYGSASDLAHQLSHGVGGKFKLSIHSKLMMVIQRRIASNLITALRNKVAKEAEEMCALGQFAAAVVPMQFAIALGDLPSLALNARLRNKVAKEAEEMCALGQFAAAVVPMQFAIALGDLPSLALNARLLIFGRDGIKRDIMKAFVLAEVGMRFGCHHCQGLMAWHYFEGLVCEEDYAQSLKLARMSSKSGSRYGQYAFGELYHNGAGRLAKNDARAVVFFRLAAAQGLDVAQFMLGYMYYHGYGVDQDLAEALRQFQFAAAQGYPQALYYIADCHEHGWGVYKDVAEAIRWYRCAHAAGHPNAAAALHRLGA